jgi:hypothetical protein
MNRMKKTLIALALSAAVLIPTITMPTTASAAPLCTTGLQQSDMAGRYISDTMVVDITPCAVTHVAWSNAYGQHTAYYVGTQRYVGDGFLAMGTQPDPMTGHYLDAASAIGIKAAERGYVQLVTVDGLLGTQVYRLKKVASY